MKVPAIIKLRRALNRWLGSRDYHLLLLGTPALAGCLAGLGFGFCLAFWRPAQITADYTNLAQRALARRDYETVRVASQRLFELATAPRPQDAFNLALAFGGLGREKDAVALLGRIASPDKPGYPPAHLFLARSLLARTNMTPQELGVAEKHLKQVIVLEPESAEANELLGRIYVRLGQWDLAQKHLSAIAAAGPEAVLLLAAVARAQGDNAEARIWAQRAAKYYREKVETAKLDNPANRLAWADAMAMQEDYAAAYGIVEKGWINYTNTIYLAPLGQVCALWADLLAKTKPGDLAARFTLIQRGLECVPQNEMLLRHLISLTHQPGPEAERARATLIQMLSAGKAVGVLHFVLGLDAWQHSHSDEARQHFTLAYESTPQLPAVANNMAMILSLGDRPDLTRALAIIESVLAKFPNNPNFRETRGEILVRSGRWREAVADLEFALPRLASPSTAHKALAEAYRGLGLRELADEHERLARPPAEPAQRAEPAHR